MSEFNKAGIIFSSKEKKITEKPAIQIFQKKIAFVNVIISHQQRRTSNLKLLSH